MVGGQHLCAQVCSLPRHSASAAAGGGAPAHVISVSGGLSVAGLGAFLLVVLWVTVALDRVLLL